MLEDVNIPDPEAYRQLSNHFKNWASQHQDDMQQLDAGHSNLIDSWEGDGASAYSQLHARTQQIGDHHQQQRQQASSTLDRTADKLDDAQTKKNLAIGLAVAGGVAIIAAIFSFGIAAAGAAAAEGGAIAAEEAVTTAIEEASSIFEDGFTTLGEDVVEDASTLPGEILPEAPPEVSPIPEPMFGFGNAIDIDGDTVMVDSDGSLVDIDGDTEMAEPSESSSPSSTPQSNNLFTSGQMKPYTPNKPYIPQEQPSSCLAASTRMILNDNGIVDTEGDIAAAANIDGTGAGGSFPDLANALTSRGIPVTRINTVQELGNAISSNRPFIAGLRPSGGGIGHAVVVDGFDPATGDILVRDPEFGPYMADPAAFLSQWAGGLSIG